MTGAGNRPRPDGDTLFNAVDQIDQAIADLPVDQQLGVLAIVTARATQRRDVSAPVTAPACSEWLTAQQVADVFHVPASQIYALARQRRLPHVKLGEKYVRFRLDELIDRLGVPAAEGAKLVSLRPRKKRSNGAASRVPATALQPPARRAG
jgi:excisionase family DNA binding protein